MYELWLPQALLFQINALQKNKSPVKGINEMYQIYLFQNHFKFYKYI